MGAEENTKIVKQTYEAFLRGDIESLLKLYSQDVQWEIYGPASIPTAGVRRGLGELAQFFATVNEVLEVKKFEPQEFIAQGDQVAVIGRYEWRAKTTGRPFNSNWVHVVTLNGGKITRFREYTDTAAAAEAFAG